MKEMSVKYVGLINYLCENGCSADFIADRLTLSKNVVEQAIGRYYADITPQKANSVRSLLASGENKATIAVDTGVSLRMMDKLSGYPYKTDFKNVPLSAPLVRRIIEYLQEFPKTPYHEIAKKFYISKTSAERLRLMYDNRQAFKNGEYMNGMFKYTSFQLIERFREALTLLEPNNVAEVTETIKDETQNVSDDILIHTFHYVEVGDLILTHDIPTGKCALRINGGDTYELTMDHLHTLAKISKALDALN